MKKRLRFRSDGSFTIVQFTDTHFETGGENDQRTAALMGMVLDMEQPDLVVLTGDVIGGEGATDPRCAWQMAASPMVARNLPWCAIFGNHDDECGRSRAELLTIQQEITGCLTLPGPAGVSGLGNFTLRVQSHRGRQVAVLLCCLDTNAYAETAVGGYGWVRQDQVRWFSRTMQSLAASSGAAEVPALVFIHIPLPEYVEVWQTGRCLGEKNEAVCCPKINTGLFAAMHLAGNVRGVFAGHDHINDYEGLLHGLRLCYGRATGYNTYGQDDFKRGARVIRLQQGEPNFTTWLRLDDGSRLDRPFPYPE
jgi:hypothetical protein